MKWLFWLVFIMGIVWLVSCSSLELLPPPQVVGQAADAVTPADNPTAGHAITPNQFDLNRSIEWLWDQNGVYLLDPGSSIARELFIDGNSAPIPNLQGVTFSLHGSGLEEFYVWLWTPIAVYRYSDDGILVKVQDAAAQDIRGVQNIIAIPGAKGEPDTVWLWTANNFYQLWAVGEQTQFVPSPQVVVGVQAIRATPDPRFILLWSVANFYLYDLDEDQLYPINNPAGSSMTGVRGIWIEPPKSLEESAKEIPFVLWVWNDIDLYRFRFPVPPPPTAPTPLPPEPTPTPLPTLPVPLAEKISNPMGGGINQVRGVTRALMGPNVDSLIWIWTVDQLYFLPTREATQTEAISLIAGDIRLDSIAAATNCSYNGAPIYVWNAHYLFEVNTYNKTVKVIDRPDGTARNNNIRQVVACPMRAAGAIYLPDDVWWWDDSGIYQRVNRSFLARSIMFEDSYIPNVRGMMVGLYPDGQIFWFWSDTHVYQLMPDQGGMKEIFAPDGSPLVNVWMVLMRPDKNESVTGYTVLIRNEQGAFQYMEGNERVSVLRAGSNEKAIISPAYQISTQGMVLVGESALLMGKGGLETTFTMVLRAGSEDAAATILIPPGRCDDMPPGCEE